MRPADSETPQRHPRDGLAYTDSMRILAIDASTEWLCAALAIDGVLTCSRQEPGGAATSRRLLPLAAELLAQAGQHWTGLSAIAVGVGPGAFTGLRSACSAAQGMAMGLNVPVLPIDSLQIVAESARHRVTQAGAPISLVGATFAVAVDARMGQVYDGLYRWTGERWICERPAQVRAPDEVADDWLSLSERPLVWAGSGVALMSPAFLHSAAGEGVRTEIEEGDRALALGQCALQDWHQGLRLDAAQVMPRYVRDRVALTTQEREAAARGATIHG